MLRESLGKMSAAGSVVLIYYVTSLDLAPLGFTPTKVLSQIQVDPLETKQQWGRELGPSNFSITNGALR